ncbi:hypothetical protein CUMW_223110 [Citrus unshiu]|uniref:Uncharacterized protein n=1 Tax=Citrus unshiu TaxID=55188 RepID=A0A2H5QEU9_CITUN|nr:hypothetical protein CUMW_223110 [Citrus unshiu]
MICLPIQHNHIKTWNQLLRNITDESGQRLASGVTKAVDLQIVRDQELDRLSWRLLFQRLGFRLRLRKKGGHADRTSDPFEE